MLQRSTWQSDRDFPTMDPPRTVAPGEIVDHPEPLAGFEPVDEPVEDEERPSVHPADKPSRKKDQS